MHANCGVLKEEVLHGRGLSKRDYLYKRIATRFDSNNYIVHPSTSSVGIVDFLRLFYQFRVMIESFRTNKLGSGDNSKVLTYFFECEYTFNSY